MSDDNEAEILRLTADIGEIIAVIQSAQGEMSDAVRMDLSGVVGDAVEKLLTIPTQPGTHSHTAKMLAARNYFLLSRCDQYGAISPSADLVDRMTWSAFHDMFPVREFHREVMSQPEPPAP